MNYSGNEVKEFLVTKGGQKHRYFERYRYRCAHAFFIGLVTLGSFFTYDKSEVEILSFGDVGAVYTDYRGMFFAADFG